MTAARLPLPQQQGAVVAAFSVSNLPFGSGCLVMFSSPAHPTLWVPITLSRPLTWCLSLEQAVVKLGIWLREGQTIRHCQYPCHYDSPTWRCCGCSAGSPCSPDLTTPRTPRSSSCVTRSLCSSAR